jgi:hypothetical protein
MQMNWAGSLYSSNSLGDGEIDKRRSCTQLDGVCVFFFPLISVSLAKTHTQIEHLENRRRRERRKKK